MRVVLVDRLLMQGEARNIGLRQAYERFCVVLENDTIVTKTGLLLCLNVCEKKGLQQSCR